jgi:hypothetical protein
MWLHRKSENSQFPSLLIIWILVHDFAGTNRTTQATTNNVGDARPWSVLASVRMWMWNKTGDSTDGCYTVHTGGGDKKKVQLQDG